MFLISECVWSFKNQMRMPLEIMHLNKTPCDSVPNSEHSVVKKETLIIKHEEFKAINREKIF